jgi:hypothetical protein
VDGSHGRHPNAPRRAPAGDSPARGAGAPLQGDGTGAWRSAGNGRIEVEGRRAVEEHLARCGACAAELALLRSISQSLGERRSPEMTNAELDRLHDAGEAAGAYPASLYRMVGTLAAIAASVLIVSSVWLNELPPPATPSRPAAVAQAPAWERVAVTLRVDPLSNGLDSEVYLADASRFSEAGWEQGHCACTPMRSRTDSPAGCSHRVGPRAVQDVLRPAHISHIEFMRMRSSALGPAVHWPRHYSRVGGGSAAGDATQPWGGARGAPAGRATGSPPACQVRTKIPAPWRLHGDLAPSQHSRPRRRLRAHHDRAVGAKATAVCRGSRRE